MNETFEIARKNMVINQLRPNKINEENILNIFANIYNSRQQAEIVPFID